MSCVRQADRAQGTALLTHLHAHGLEEVLEVGDGRDVEVTAPEGVRLRGRPARPAAAGAAGLNHGARLWCCLLSQRAAPVVAAVSTLLETTWLTETAGAEAERTSCGSVVPWLGSGARFAVRRRLISLFCNRSSDSCITRFCCLSCCTSFS